MYATLRVLALQGAGHIEMQRDLRNHSSKVVAIIGPDNTDHAVTTAALLGPFLMPLVSWVSGISRVEGGGGCHPCSDQAVPSSLGGAAGMLPIIATAQSSCLPLSELPPYFCLSHHGRARPFKIFFFVLF